MRGDHTECPNLKRGKGTDAGQYEECFEKIGKYVYDTVRKHCGIAAPFPAES